jgi:hypothetical protein
MTGERQRWRFFTQTRRVLPILYVALATLLGSSSLGCREPNVSLAEGPREYVAIDYPQVLTRWTREKSMFSVEQLDSALTVTATYESWDFRWAYTIRYAEDYRLPLDERQKLLDKLLKETRETHCFYVALYGGSQPRFTDLTKSTSGWVVRLVDDRGNEIVASSIDKIARPGPLEKTYFPYTSPWRQAFRIRFPRNRPDNKQATIATDAKWVGLRFAGPQGSEELRWQL